MYYICCICHMLDSSYNYGGKGSTIFTILVQKQPLINISVQIRKPRFGKYCSYFQNNKLFFQIADRGDVIPLPIHLYAVLFAHVNSSINCIIYGLTNKQFRFVPTSKQECIRLKAHHPLWDRNPNTYNLTLE